MFRSKLFGFTQGSHWAQPGTNGRIMCGKGRDASRPISQFVYQMFKESAKEQLNTGILIYRPHTNSEAYHKVKSRWIEWGIWDEEWEILPGMSWKHEHPLEDPFREGLGDEKPLLPRAISTGARSLTPTGRLSHGVWSGRRRKEEVVCLGRHRKGEVCPKDPQSGVIALEREMRLWERRKACLLADHQHRDSTRPGPIRQVRSRGKYRQDRVHFQRPPPRWKAQGRSPFLQGVRTPRARV